MKQGMIAVMQRISQRDQESRVRMLEVFHQVTRNVVEGVESFKHSLKGSIDVFNCLFTINFCQVGIAEMGFPVKPHVVGKPSESRFDSVHILS